MNSRRTESTRIHLACVAPEPEISERLGKLAREFEYGFLSCSSTEAFMSDMKDDQIVMVVLAAMSLPSPQDIAGHVQVISQVAQEAFILVLVGRKVSAEDVAFIKKSGANLIMMEDRFFQTSQMEYICSQIIRGSLIPIKPGEIVVNTTLDFSIYVMMPLNRKILPIVSKGTPISESRYKKMLEAKELYVRREDFKKFKAYMEVNMDRSAQGLGSRCRLKFLDLVHAHAELIFLLLDQSEAASFVKGKQYFEACQVLASDLLIALASVEDPWTIVNSSTIGESGSVERSVAYGAMAGVTALNLGEMSESDVLLAGLLCDFGMLDIEPRILEKIRTSGIGSLNPEELVAYQSHPLVSVNRCLSQRLPLPEKVKNIILATHEQANGKGFPKHMPESRIPIEAQLIHFCQMVDESTIVRMGEAKKNVKVVQKNIVEQELATKTYFSLDFLSRVRNTLGV